MPKNLNLDLQKPISTAVLLTTAPIILFHVRHWNFSQKISKNFRAMTQQDWRLQSDRAQRGAGRQSRLQ